MYALSRSCFSVVHVIDTVGASKKVLVLEFGVFKGRSIKYFASRMTAPGSRFYRFDSFEGLLEAWGKKAGGFLAKVPIVDDERILFIKGWFQESLPKLAVRPVGFRRGARASRCGFVFFHALRPVTALAKARLVSRRVR